MKNLNKLKPSILLKRSAVILLLVAFAYFISGLSPADLWLIVSAWLSGSDDSVYFKVVPSEGFSFNWVWLVISSTFIFIYAILIICKNKTKNGV